MNAPLWFQNLAALWVQIALVAASGIILPRLLALRAPKAVVICWQILLAGCLALPLLEPWKRLVLTLPTDLGNVDIRLGPALSAPRHAAISVFQAIAIVLAAGAVARLCWIAFGLRRLREYCRSSREIDAWIPAFAGMTDQRDFLREHESLAARRGNKPKFLISDAISSPATFGIFDPVVLLPARFTEMQRGRQHAILCHELAHIQRRDWMFNLAEELVLALLWFHPAIWWLISQIRLAREQAVDQAVLEITGARKPYLEALLDLATCAKAPQSVPAPLFLKEHQLAQRVTLMLKEGSMSKRRTVISLAAACAVVLVTTMTAVRAFPLRARSFEFAQTDTTKQNAQGQGAAAEAAPSPDLTPPVGGVSQGVASGVRGGVVATDGQAPDKVPNEPGVEEIIETPGHSKDSIGLNLVSHVAPAYPPLAKMARIQGTVTLRATVEKSGKVSNVEVVGGHPLLAQAAIDAVSKWKFEPPEKQVTANVQVNFRLPVITDDAEAFAAAKARLEREQAEDYARLSEEQKAALAKLAAEQENNLIQSKQEQKQQLAELEEDDAMKARAALAEQTAVNLKAKLDRQQAEYFAGLSDKQKNDLQKELAIKQELLKLAAIQTPTAAGIEALKHESEELPQVKAEMDQLQHATATTRSQKEMLESLRAQKAEMNASLDEQIAALERLIRAQEAASKSNSAAPVKGVAVKPVKTVPPVYPPEAKQKHIQGTVILNATVEADGSVSNLEVVSGPEILTKAAEDAVRQWKFSNPNGVAVITSITVNFALN